MTLLDRFRTVPRDKHPDPAVRLAHVAELPLSDRQAIEAMARDDQDPRVRRAAVAKLLDPAALGRILRQDSDESVRGAASGMLRDLALEAFEGLSEAEALDAVEALDDGPTLTQIAKTATRDVVALRALSRVNDGRQLGSIARHGGVESVRRSALALVRDRGDAAEILAVAMNADHKDTAVAAVDLIDDRALLEQIAERSRSKPAAKRARAMMRERDERQQAEIAAAAASAASAAYVVPESPAVVSDSVPLETADPGEGARHAEVAEPAESAASSHGGVVVPNDDGQEGDAAASGQTPAEPDNRSEDDRRREAELDAARRAARMAEVAELIDQAIAETDHAAGQRRLEPLRREWEQLQRDGGSDAAEVEARAAAALAGWDAREAQARETEARARREALARIENLVSRMEAFAQRGDISLKAADRALRDIRTALGDMPRLPTKEDFLDVTRRLKAAQALLTPRLQELREADEWQRWANATIQEQLCVRMEALQAVDDPERAANEVRELQRQWREAADVPRAQADALWRRFKAAHDIVWTKCEAHFAARSETYKANLVRKIALCEKAESLAESSSWLETAEEIKKLQAEWKTIGAVPRGQEKAIWERFRVPCDRFFTRRTEDLARRKAVWAENLAKKTALCERAEALAASTDWENAAAEIKRLQAEWKEIGAVKKSRSEAIWQRFRGACDQFFHNYTHRDDSARAERTAAREALVMELEALADQETSADGNSAALASIRRLQERWKQESGTRVGDPAAARALGDRFTAAFAHACARWSDAVRGTELDPEANQKRMEALVARMEELGRSVSSPGDAEGVSPTTRLAAMLKEALAANTIGGAVDEHTRKAAILDELRQAQSAWTRIGPVPDPMRTTLQDRFHRACRQVFEKAGSASRPTARPDTAAAGPQQRPR